MKRSSKRSISLLVAFCMLCMCMVNVAFADDTTAAVSLEVTFDEDGQAVVSIVAAENAGVTSGKIAFTYDTTHLTYVSGAAGTTGALAMPNTNTEGTFIMSYAAAQAFSGTIYSVTFSLNGTFDASYITITDYSVGNENAETMETIDAAVPVVNVTCTHSYDNGVVTKEATCTEAGEKTYTCSLCGATYTEAIEKIAHTADEGTVTTAATCTEDGVMTYTCTVCGSTWTEAIPATGHTWDDGVVTKEATETENGVKTYTCTVCGETKTEEIVYSAPEGDANYVVIFAAFAMIALAGCAVANRKSTY